MCGRYMAPCFTDVKEHGTHGSVCRMYSQISHHGTRSFLSHHTAPLFCLRRRILHRTMPLLIKKTMKSKNTQYTVWWDLKFCSILFCPEQDIVVLWSKSSTLDREIRGSNLGGTRKWKTTNFFILLNRREETQKDDAEDIESSRIGSR